MDLFKWMITLSFLAIEAWCTSLYTDPGRHDNIRSLLTHLKLDEQRKAYIPHFPYFEKNGLSTQESVNAESIINPEQVSLNNVRQKHYEFNGKGIIQSAYHRYISSESDGFVRKGSIPDIFLVTKLEADKPIVMVVNGHAINIRPQHFDLWYKALTKFTQKKHSSTEEKYRMVNDRNRHLTGMKPSLTESSSSSDSNSRPGQMHRIRDSLKYGDYIRWQENNQGNRNRKHAIAQYVLFKKSEGERKQYPTGREPIEYHDTGSLQIRTRRLEAHKPQEDEFYSQGHLPLEYHAFVSLKELPEKHLLDPSEDKTMRHESYNEYFGTPSSDYLPHDYSSLKLPFTKQPRGHPNFHFFSTNQAQKYPNSHFPFSANQHGKYPDHYSPEDQPEEYPDSPYFSENQPEKYPGSVYFSEKQTEEYLSSYRKEDRLQKNHNFFYSSTNQPLVYPSSYYTKNHLPGYPGAFYSPQNQTEEYLGALPSSENPSQERNLYPSKEVPVANKILQPEGIPSKYDEHEVETVPDDHGQRHLQNVYEKYDEHKPGNITNEPNNFHHPENMAIVHNISLEQISSYFLSSIVNITEISVAYVQGEKNLLEGKRLQESNTLTTNEENRKENDVGNQHSFFRRIPNMEGSGSFALPLNNSSVMQRNFVNLEKFEIVSNSDPEFDQDSEVYFEYDGSGDVESNDILKKSWLMLSDGPPENVSSFFGPSNKTATGRFIDVFSSPNDSSTPCTTPKNEPGHCRSIRHCLLHDVLNNYKLFLEHICLLRRTFVGVCCPDNPVINEILESEDVVLNNSFPLEYNQPLEGCGLNTKTRIVGGSVSQPHEWTWMVALMRRNRFFCGGVIINDWYVLTAAHCTLGINIKEIKIRLGEYNFLDSRTTHEDIEISEIKRHAQFITATFQHDIALLKLGRKIQYSKYVGSICLPQKGKDFTEINATVVGWGTVSFGGSVSPILRQVTVPVWRNADCDGTYVLENINDSFLCAGSPDSEQDACQGDSGGPLMAINEKERWEVIGIVSWGRRCGDPNYPGVYTRVTTYLDWIEDNMQ